MRFKIALSALALALVAGVAFISQGDTPMTTAFDTARWQDEAAAQVEPYPRRAMVDAALALLTPGMPRAAIVAQLGEPVVTDKFPGRGLVYFIGVERGFIAVDAQWLVIDLDAAGLMTGAEILSD